MFPEAMFGKAAQRLPPCYSHSCTTPLGAETKGIGELFTSSVPKMSQEKFFYPEIGSDMNLNGSLKSLRC